MRSACLRWALCGSWCGAAGSKWWQSRLHPQLMTARPRGGCRCVTTPPLVTSLVAAARQRGRREARVRLWHPRLRQPAVGGAVIEGKTAMPLLLLLRMQTSRRRRQHQRWVQLRQPAALPSGHPPTFLSLRRSFSGSGRARLTHHPPHRRRPLHPRLFHRPRSKLRLLRLLWKKSCSGYSCRFEMRGRSCSSSSCSSFRCSSFRCSSSSSLTPKEPSHAQ